MTEDDVAIAVTEWARETLPDLLEGRSWLTAHKTRLPDVVVDVAEKSVQRGDPRFLRARIQQAWIRVFTLDLAFMVESKNDPDADETETKQLREFGAALESSLLNDDTLGERVQMASPLTTFDYRLPFVQYEDGTRGRQMTMSLVVGELIRGEQ